MARPRKPSRAISYCLVGKDRLKNPDFQKRRFISVDDPVSPFVDEEITALGVRASDVEGYRRKHYQGMIPFCSKSNDRDR